MYLTSNAGFTEVSFQSNSAPSGGAVGVGQSSSGIYFNGCTFNVSLLLVALHGWLVGVWFGFAGCRQSRKGGHFFNGCTFNMLLACYEGGTNGGRRIKGCTCCPQLNCPLQGNSADVFGNDVYMESWVATPAYFNPFPTTARALACAAAGRPGHGMLVAHLLLVHPTMQPQLAAAALMHGCIDALANAGVCTLWCPPGLQLSGSPCLPACLPQRCTPSLPLRPTLASVG